MDLDPAVEQEMSRNEGEALKAHYERRCKLLSDAALHWKSQTTTLYNKFASSLAMLREEHDKYRADTDAEMRKLKVDYDREVDAVNRKYIDV